jgi:hypothetical protein
VLALRQVIRCVSLASAALVLAALASGPARAQGKLEAQYTVTLAGIPIGKGSWVVDIADTHYAASVSGMTTGLLRVFTGGQGTGAARGTLSAGRPLSAVYTAAITTKKKTDEIGSPSPTATSRIPRSIRRWTAIRSACRSPRRISTAFSIR